MRDRVLAAGLMFEMAAWSTVSSGKSEKKKVKETFHRVLGNRELNLS